MPIPRKPAAVMVVVLVCPVAKRLWSAVVEKKVVVVAFVPRRLVMTPLVAWSAVAKSEVVVALLVVAFSAVKFWRVEEAKEMRPPQNWEATVVEVATT